MKQTLTNYTHIMSQLRSLTTRRLRLWPVAKSVTIPAWLLAILLFITGGAGLRFFSASAVSLTTLGSPYTQNFDTLTTSGTANTWTDDTTVPGWYAQFSLQPSSPTTYRADSGGSNTGAIYSWGVAGTNPLTERAFGSIASGTPGDIFYALKLTNNTGTTITSLSISYTGEQWRQGGCTPTPCTPAAQKLDFQYQVANAGVITDANTPTTGWLDHDALDFTSPQPGTSTAAAIDGNAAANRTALSSTINVTINAGQEVWLRWKDFNDANNDHGLAIDDFSVTPNATATPTLNIGDVTQAEGDAGTTTFNFTVSLTSPAGGSGVSFTINTADGTTNPANAGSDYVAIVNGSGSISSSNTSTTVSVTVNGDTTPEPSETFFVNISNIIGANAGDVQGLGTINNDDVTLTPIHTIQGSGSTSPLATQTVTTRGVVTGIKSGSSGGFFIQEPDASVDADPNTSEGIFVFTGASVPAAVVVGNFVQVAGTVQEFVFSSDPNSPPITEISGSPTATLLTTGNPLPTPITLTIANTTAPSSTSNPLDTLERFEGMRVTVPSMTVVAPTDGTITESSATVGGNDVFYGVVTGVPRPFREPGVSISDPLPPGSPANVPRFDENPERIRVDSDGQPGTTAVDVAAGTIITNVTGPLDYQFRTYTILPDTTLIPGSQPGSTPVPVPNANELTVASFNLERFFDTMDDPGTSDPVLTQAAFDKRLDKASRIIRTTQRYPDVIGVEEMENLSTLQAVAAKLNADAQSIDMLPNPNYVAYLVEGNDVGGIDVGFLVKESRVTTVSVTQFNKTETYINPNTGASETLNDRPPLVLNATIGPFAFRVIVNHLRSLSGIDDTTPNGTGTEGSRVRAKRKAQAESLANLIQSLQTANPNQPLITVGDMNAFRVNDGYVDVIGTILGTPSPDDQTVVPGDGADLVNPNQTDLVDMLAADQRYSFTFDGNAQVLDHIIVNPKALSLLSRFAYARDDADFPVQNYELANELRLSDHDQPVAYFTLPTATVSGGGTICAGSSANVTVTVSGGTAPYTVTLTNSGGTQTGNGPAFTFPVSPSMTTTYTLAAGSVDANNIPISGSGSATVMVNQLPSAPTITPNGPTTFCQGGSVTLMSSSASGNQWYLNGNSISGAAGQSYVAMTAGDYTVKVTDANNCTSAASAPTTVIVNPNPATPTITPTQPQVCANSTGNTASGPAGATSYAWMITNGTITNGANSQTVTYTAGASGNVTLNLTVTNASNCSASNSANVLINSNPSTPTITPVQTQVCAGSTGNQASGPAGASSYAWTISNGTITSGANSQTVTYTAGASGNVTLNLTVTNASNCSASNSASVPINPVPTCSITGPDIVLSSTTNTYTGTSSQSGSSFSWSVSGNAMLSGPTNSASVSVIAQASGSYTLTLTVSKNGCSSTCTKFVNITSQFNTLSGSIRDPLACTGPGNVIEGTIQLGNPTGAQQTFVLTTTFTNYVGVPNSCTLTGAVAGATCTVSAGGLSANGFIPANGTLTVQYQAQVAQVGTGSPLIASNSATLGGSPVAPNPLVFSATVTCPAVGPGSLISDAAEVSDQKAGSVLVYNLYSSSIAAPNAQNTRVALTNTHPSLPVVVHLFFVDGATCSIADSLVCLTPNQTASFLASDIDPGTTGYIIAVASDRVTGCPVDFNYLIGDEYVKLSSGHAANLTAEAFAALAGGLPVCNANSVTTVLSFDGTSYNRAPRVLAASNIPSRANGNDTLIVLNRVGGSLASGAATLGNLFGILYDDAENPLSFTFSAGVCQFRSSLSSSFPRTTPRFEQFIPAGRSGWAKFYSLADIGLLGAQLNFNANAGTAANAFNQGHNLHKLTLTSAAQLTIPVFPPNC